jgi:hypothetical protein
MRYSTTILHLSIFGTLMFLLGGCHASAGINPPPKHTETVTQETTVVHTDPLHAQSERIEDYASDIQNARDSISEAAAIERLRRFERDHNLTYTVNTVRLDTGVSTPAASAQGIPIRADVSVYRGQIPIYNFSFIPKDNRNLALLGE